MDRLKILCAALALMCLGGDSFTGQSFPAYRRLFPLPPTELASNSSLAQNPGYADIGK